MTNVFILAAGTSRRFGGKILKQELPINGEKIIRRIIRQVREYDNRINIYILTWHDTLKFGDVNIIDTKVRPQELSDTILLSYPYWGKRNVILLGDVVYSNDTINKILSHNNGVTIFARDKCPIKSSSERVALTFPIEYSNYLWLLLHKAARIFRYDGREGHAGMQKICLSTKPDWLLPFVHNTPIHPLIRPFRDYFIYHIYTTSWYPSFPVHLELVDDSITTDIDTPEEYQKFIAMAKL